MKYNKRNLRIIASSLVVCCMLIAAISYCFLNQSRIVAQPIVHGSLHKVVVTDSGFLPAHITVEVGDTVEWQNNSSKDMWPSSDLHPTHSLYPGSGIWKCGTDTDEALFDSCLPVPVGKSYSFTFTKKGEWSYHDHLWPSRRGKVNSR